MTELTPNRRAAAKWAADILSKNPLILDTETTGKDWRAEIIQIAVIDLQGNPLLNSFVKHSEAAYIEPEAEMIHGINEAMLNDAYGWDVMHAKVYDLLSGRPLIIYNAQFDVARLNRSTFVLDFLTEWNSVPSSIECAMLRYAEYWGDWNDYRSSWKWQTLDRACKQQRLAEPDAPAHSALGDCLRTLALVKAMAAALPFEAEGQGGS